MRILVLLDYEKWHRAIVVIMVNNDFDHLVDAAAILQREQQKSQLAKIQGELNSIRETQQAGNTGPQCPVCGGRLPGEFRKCTHCASDLIWVEGLPGEPGKQAELLAKLKQKKDEAQAEFERQEEIRSRRPYCTKCGQQFVPELGQMRDDLCWVCYRPFRNFVYVFAGVIGLLLAFVLCSLG